MEAKALRPGWKVVDFGEIAEIIAMSVDTTGIKTDVDVGQEYLTSGMLNPHQWANLFDVTEQTLTNRMERT